jgi:erythromycin esterase
MWRIATAGFLIAVACSAKESKPGSGSAPAPITSPGDAMVSDEVDLGKAIVRLRSRDPRDEDFADLAPLRAVLANARIVQLGEQTHGDGASFEAKVRLVKFLHRELGFSVIAFESGFYDCAKAWERILAGDNARSAARSAIFPLWSASAQVQPLWDYLGSQAKTAQPLELAGFDSQFTGAYSTRDLVPELGKLIGDPAAAEPLRALIDYEGKTSAAQREDQRAAIERVSRKLPTQAVFWKQLLRSMLRQAEDDWAAEDGGLAAALSAASNNARDRQMAENLLWLAAEKYPGKKIIVWGATAHVMRNASTLEEDGLLGRSKPFAELVPMGHHVSEKLGDAVYTIGFLAYEGTWKWATNDALGATIPPAPAGSFEALLARTGVENAFLDLKGNQARLRKPRVARPCGYSEMMGDWTQVVDGFVFTKTMTPSEPAP